MIPSSARARLAAAASLLAFSAAAVAVPVHSDNADVSSWEVGSGQVNGNFSVTTDDTFGAGGLQIGLRAEQRRIGAVVPTFADQFGLDGYVVEPGLDPGTTDRAWWNFQLSIAYEDDIEELDSLTLYIQKAGGTNSPPVAPGAYDLIALRGAIDARNPVPDPTYADVYQASQNPLFGWFDPAYSVDPGETFAYRFTILAAEGGEFLHSSMCVATAGLDCSGAPSPLDEPLTVALLGAGLAGVLRLRRRRA